MHPASATRRACAGSRISILDPPGWRPRLAGEGRPFAMTDLLLYAADGDVVALGPPDA